MNKETLQPDSLNGLINSLNLFSSFKTSKPPSVVRSSLFSGTRHTAWGLCLSAIFCISSVAAISKFNGMFKAAINPSISSSRIWRRSSLRCAVMPSAPSFWARIAASTGSGYILPLAFRIVAT